MQTQDWCGSEIVPMNKENKYKVGTLIRTLHSPNWRIYIITECLENWCANGKNSYRCRGIACEEKHKNIFYWSAISEDTLDGSFEILEGKR